MKSSIYLNRRVFVMNSIHEIQNSKKKKKKGKKKKIPHVIDTEGPHQPPGHQPRFQHTQKNIRFQRTPCLTFTMLGNTLADVHIEFFFFSFKKQVLTFHSNGLMKCSILFSGKYKKKYSR